MIAGMFPNNLFHIDHIIPMAVFVSAIMEFADFGIAHMLMELRAVYQRRTLEELFPSN